MERMKEGLEEGKPTPPSYEGGEAYLCRYVRVENVRIPLQIYVYLLHLGGILRFMSISGVEWSQLELQGTGS